MEAVEKKLIKNKKKIAFVASGGAVKAACFHIGVMLAMERFGFSFLGGLKDDKADSEAKPGQVSVYVGSSAGSFIASLMAGGFTPEELYSSLSENYAHKKSGLRSISYGDIIGNNIFSNLASMVGSLVKAKGVKKLSIEGFMHAVFGLNGLFNTQNVGKYLKSVMPTDRFQDLASELYIVTTDLDNPEKIVMGPRELIASTRSKFATDVNISDAAIGSMSLPIIFGPYKMKINGEEKYIFDGEIRNTLSSHLAKDAGADLVIASYTHQPYNFNPDFGSLINYGLPTIIIQTMYQIIESRIYAVKTKHDMKVTAVEEMTKYCIEKEFSKELSDEIIKRLQKSLAYDPNIDYIYIAPDPMDSTMFFEDHFNLSQASMGKIIRSGFKSAYHTFSKYQFDFSSREPVQVEFRTEPEKDLLASQ